MLYRFKVTITDYDDKTTTYICGDIDTDIYYDYEEKYFNSSMDDIVLTVEGGDYERHKVYNIKSMTVEYNGDGYVEE